jgi:hypothetical protein
MPLQARAVMVSTPQKRHRFPLESGLLLFWMTVYLIFLKKIWNIAEKPGIPAFLEGILFRKVA